jgi:hypothetical protein
MKAGAPEAKSEAPAPKAATVKAAVATVLISSIQQCDPES